MGMASKMVAKTKTITDARAEKGSGARKMRKQNEMPKPEKKRSSVVKKKQQDKKSHKKAWIIGGVVLIVLIGAGVGCALLIPPLFQPKYGESYSIAVDIKGKLDDMYSEKKAPCQEVIDNLHDENVSVERFDKMIDGCRSDLEETRELVDRLGESSGIVKDETLKKKFDKFAKSAESTMPTDEKIEQGLKAYQAIHEFTVRMSDLDEDDLNEAAARDIVKVLIDSGDETLIELGHGFEQHFLKIVSIYDRIQGMDEISYEQYRAISEEAEEATNEYNEWASEQKDIIANKDWMLDEDSIEATKKDFDDLYKAIREMYEKHYDGKNEVECSKKGDGVVKCK